MAVPLTVYVWRFIFNTITRFLKIIKQRMDKNNRHIKILYKRVKANTNAIWQHLLHMYTNN